MPIDPRDLITPSPPPVEATPVLLGGTRAERIQRLQVGGFGLAAMVLMVALADIVISRARETDAASVADAAPVVAAEETEAPRDPLADAGVLPDIPDDPAAPETGNAPAPAQP